LTEDKFRRLVIQPESSNIELRAAVPSSGIIARDISAFANAEGGTILLGVSKNGTVVGLANPARAVDAIKNALTRISPEIAVTPQIEEVSGKSLLRIAIDRGDKAPYLADGVAHVRQANKVVPISSGAIVDTVQSRAGSRDEILDEVRHLSETIETLNAELIAARSWRTKLVDMLIGGIIGAAISLLLASLIG
jgi:predicted HTH transcriptional regulator